MPRFGKSSRVQRDTCDVRIARAADALIEVHDFSFLCGHRGEAEQNAYYDAGTSKVKYPNSKHNETPSLACDLCPYHKTYGRLIGTKDQIREIALAETERRGKMVSTAEIDGWIREQYTHLAGRFIEAARWQGTALRWGGDWDCDGDLLDNTFDDLGHFEIRY